MGFLGSWGFCKPESTPFDALVRGRKLLSSLKLATLQYALSCDYLGLLTSDNCRYTLAL